MLEQAGPLPPDLYFKAKRLNLCLNVRLQLRWVFFSSELDCEAIEVTADPSSSHVGIYLPWNEKTSEKSVWKIQHGDRFIFNFGQDSGGYRIGSKSSLTSGRFYCEGKHILTPFLVP